jgi:hypothetical protein
MKHLSDSELILAIDNDLTPAVRGHLDTCDECRFRMHTYQGILRDHSDIRNSISLPSPQRSRAMLRANLKAEMEHSGSSFSFRKTVLVAAGIAFVITLLPMILDTTARAGARPRSAITPGDVRPIGLDEVCRTGEAQVVVRDIPADTRKAVFAAYGIRPDSGKYEVDYLITPDLGGRDTVRNMWPQPYSTAWNAREKDKLEQRLHQMVCNRQMDLATAQRELAADWIGAYRKYLGNR